MLELERVVSHTNLFFAYTLKYKRPVKEEYVFSEDTLFIQPSEIQAAASCSVTQAH